MQTRALGAALKRLDVFELWNLWLTTLALQAAGGARKDKRIFAWAVPWGIYALLWIMDIIGGIVGQAQAA